MKIINCPDCGTRMTLITDITLGAKFYGTCSDCGLFIERSNTGWDYRRKDDTHYVIDSSDDNSSTTGGTNA